MHKVLPLTLKFNYIIIYSQMSYLEKGKKNLPESMKNVLATFCLCIVWFDSILRCTVDKNAFYIGIILILLVEGYNR